MTKAARDRLISGKPEITSSHNQTHRSDIKPATTEFHIGLFRTINDIDCSKRLSI
jgi:hypothetical protein